MKKLVVSALCVSLIISSFACAKEKEKTGENKKNPEVLIKTSMGIIEIELYPDKAPITVKNFLSYVNEAFYDSTIFHRVIPKFMVQAGGITADNRQKKTKPTIQNEAKNGLYNNRGYITMGLLPNEIHSATSHFFINVNDNFHLNHKNDTPRGYGYAVFGKVIKGMDVADKISNVKRSRTDAPLEPVYIISIRVKKTRNEK